MCDKWGPIATSNTHCPNGNKYQNKNILELILFKKQNRKFLFLNCWFVKDMLQSAGKRRQKFLWGFPMKRSHGKSVVDTVPNL